MAEIFNFIVNDNRTITYKLTEPIMLEDNGVSTWRFHIPNIINSLDATGWAWWLVYVNAKNEKYTIPLTLEYDYDRPDAYSIATYTVDYGMSCKVGSIKFSIEAIDANVGGEILHEWHTKTYSATVEDTLQGNQVEYAETESDIISALLIEVRNKVNQLVGGAAPLPVNLKSLMIDHDKVYLYTGSEPNESTGYWYHYNGTQFVPGGQYGAGVVDSVPTQDSNNAVSSGGVYDALDGLPKTVTPEETDADFYLSDSNGNVLMELAEGHIKTKNFDSANINGDIPTSPTDSTADMDISDTNGNVLARFKDGNFYTKNFNSTFIRNLTGKKWVCLGDSLTEHNQRTTLNYHDYIAQETGINVHNLGHSGCGYAKVGGNGQNFVNQVSSIPDDASIITVFGSGNDGSASLDIGTPTDSGTSTLCGYMNAVFDKIYEEHPTTPLGVITPTPWATKEPSDSNKWMENYSNALIEICKLRGIPCLDLYHCSNLHPSDVNFRPLAYSKDDGNGVHPDETGHALIAPRIRQFLFSLI